MYILFLNGSPQDMDSMNTDLQSLVSQLSAQGHTAEEVRLNHLTIQPCLGCWDCWVKTPGECIHQDDAAGVLRKILQCDVLVMSSPLLLGYPSALLKRFMDRMIPLVHPYIVLDQGECHHLARYDHYPRMGLYLQKEADSDAEDLQIVSDLFRRAALNMKTTLQFTCTTDQTLEEVCDEINRG